jgi:DNA-directed RNA polymerase specialized sigma24 family protein
MNTEIAADSPEQIELDEIKTMTDRIRNHQRAIEEISNQRRRVIVGLRRKRITYREIAASMGVTEQSVYKILRASISSNRHP